MSIQTPPSVPATSAPPPSSKAALSKREKIAEKLLDQRAQRVLVAIVVVAVLLLVAIVVISVIVSFLRREVEVTAMSFDVGNIGVWQVGNVCDPFNVQSGQYRLNFFSGSTPFPHTVLIKSDTGETLANIVVPQDSPATLLNYSYILPQPGSYLVENYSNNVKIGSFVFQYPNACGVAR